MRPAYISAKFAAIVLGLVGLPVASSTAQEVFDSAILDDGSDQSVDVSSSINAIQKAPDPSAAVEAYARARAEAPESVTVERVYVQRMIALGAPALAEAQARDLVSRDSSDGMAWAVLAVASAGRNDWIAAFNNLVNAVQGQPDDAFVQRTAGQLIGYYGAHRDAMRVPESLNAALRHVQVVLSGKQAYQEGYREAQEAENQQTEPTTAPDYQTAPAPATTDYPYTDVYPYPDYYPYPSMGYPYFGGYYTDYYGGGLYFGRPYHHRYLWDGYYAGYPRYGFRDHDRFGHSYGFGTIAAPNHAGSIRVGNHDGRGFGDNWHRVPSYADNWQRTPSYGDSWHRVPGINDSSHFGGTNRGRSEARPQPRAAPPAAGFRAGGAPAAPRAPAVSPGARSAPAPQPRSVGGGGFRGGGRSGGFHGGGGGGFRGGSGGVGGHRR